MILGVIIAVIAAFVYSAASYEYQHIRFSVLDSEDSEHLVEARKGNVNDNWLASVQAQIERGLVNPDTLSELSSLGCLSLDGLEAYIEQAKRTYHPKILAFARRFGWFFALGAACAGILYVLTGGASNLVHPYVTALAYGVFFGSIAALSVADIQFRIIPIPFLVSFACAAPLCFDNMLLYYVIGLAICSVLILTFVNIVEHLKKQKGLFGTGDALILAVSAAVLFSFENGYNGSVLLAWCVAVALGVIITLFYLLLTAMHHTSSGNSSVPLAARFAVASFALTGRGMGATLRMRIPAGPLFTCALGVALFTVHLIG